MSAVWRSYNPHLDHAVVARLNCLWGLAGGGGGGRQGRYRDKDSRGCISLLRCSSFLLSSFFILLSWFLEFERPAKRTKGNLRTNHMLKNTF